jgi:hypothetical protein
MKSGAWTVLLENCRCSTQMRHSFSFDRLPSGVSDKKLARPVEPAEMFDPV